MKIRNAAIGDADAIADIYNHFILHTCVSFEEQAVTAADVARRITELQAGQLPWLVVCVDDAVVGYAYASNWRVRHAYRFSLESSVYLRPGMEGRGLGSALYAGLIERLRVSGHHLLIGGVALPNDASVALHEKLGFRKVAHFSEVGFKQGRWIDVGYWQLKLAAPAT